MHKPIKFIYALLIITILASSLTWCILREVRRNEVVMEALPSSDQQNKTLPTEFRKPTPEDGPPHIVGAEIERITIPECVGCYADIIKKMDGVSDEEIIKINDKLTSNIFDSKDIRNPENRKKIQKSEEGITELYTLKEEILYIDSSTKVIVYTMPEFEVVFNGASSPSVAFGLYGYLDWSSEDMLQPSQKLLTNKENVLNHFYPDFNFKKNQVIKNYSDPDYLTQFSSCYQDKAIQDFVPEFRPKTREVVFRPFFPHSESHCSSNGPDTQIQIAIPIADILREVPQYVPEGSVLWRFADK